jgi:SAM-dependent methyltransferase
MSGMGHSNHLWDTWSHLTDVVKTGEVAHVKEINERGDEWLSSFIHAMHYRGKIQAPAHVSKIDLNNVGSVLDVGGGSGVYLMAFLERKPELKTAVFDLPNVLPISKDIIKEEGYEDRIKHYEGDFTKDEIPNGFDMIFLSAIIHGNSYETNKDLVKKCYKALNPNGKIVIQDWIMDDSKTKPVQGAIFSINMLVGVEGGDCYSESEVKSWLDNAGFSDMKITGIEAGLAQVVAEKG